MLVIRCRDDVLSSATKIARRQNGTVTEQAKIVEYISGFALT